MATPSVFPMFMKAAAGGSGGPGFVLAYDLELDAAPDIEVDTAYVDVELEPEVEVDVDTEVEIEVD